MQLDPRSLIAMSGFMSAMMAVVLLFMRRNYPPSIRGLDYWAAAPVLWLVSAVLFGGRDELPQFFSVVVANQALLLGATVYYIGSRRFLGHGGGWALWGSVAVASTLVHIWLTYVAPSYAVRIAIFSLLMAVLYGAHLRFSLRHGGKSFPTRLVQVVLALHILVLMSRFTSVLMGQAGTDIMEPSPFQTAYMGAYVITVLMLSIGAILLATDRVRTELEHLATHDSLTQTLNRRAVMQLCQQELDRARRYGHGPSVMMLDLDNFKAVNDTHGHQHGDAVLVHFAACTKSALRSEDRLGRYGGEEFLVLLPDTDAPAAHHVAQRIHALLQAGHPLDCQLSIGVTTWQDTTDTLDAMLTRADAALYQAKKRGRNQTCAG
jgi:diguanylate cyclase (GGDEF)-like protein